MLMSTVEMLMGCFEQALTPSLKGDLSTCYLSNVVVGKRFCSSYMRGRRAWWACESECTILLGWPCSGRRIMVRLANDRGLSFANYIQGSQLISRSPLLSGQPLTSFAFLALKLRSTTESFWLPLSFSLKFCLGELLRRGLIIQLQ